MTYRDVTNLRMPRDRSMAWYAQSSDEWHAAMATTTPNPGSSSFITLLKELWHPSNSELSSDEHLLGTITLMYGILSVAREVSRREDSVIAQRPSPKSSSLSKTVQRALSLWETAWQKAALKYEVPWMVPTCTCVLQLARCTLYEISPVDLQVVAGKSSIDGKRKSPADYINARRRIKAWAREERGLMGIFGTLFHVHLHCSCDLDISQGLRTSFEHA